MTGLLTLMEGRPPLLLRRSRKGCLPRCPRLVAVTFSYSVWSDAGERRHRLSCFSSWASSCSFPVSHFVAGIQRWTRARIEVVPVAFPGISRSSRGEELRHRREDEFDVNPFTPIFVQLKIESVVAAKRRISTAFGMTKSRGADERMKPFKFTIIIVFNIDFDDSGKKAMGAVADPMMRTTSLLLGSSHSASRLPTTHPASAVPWRRRWEEPLVQVQEVTS